MDKSGGMEKRSLMGGGRLQEVVAHGGSTEVAFPFDISSPRTFLTGKVCKVLNWSEVGQNVTCSRANT